MKKSLLTILSAMACMSGMAQQTPSPSWTVTQNSNFPIPSAGIRYMDAFDPNTVMANGYDGTTGNTSRAYCWVTRTNNGGNSWTVSPVWQSTTTPLIGDTSTYVISNIDVQSANTAWIAAYKKVGGGSQGGVFKTTDLGATWTNVTSAAMFTNTSSFANWAVSLSPNLVIAMGDPNSSSSNEFEIWRSTNGGTSWTLVPGANIPNPTSGEFGLTNVYEKFGTSTLWFGTNKGRVIYTTDGGNTWNASTLNAGNSVSDVAFYDANNGLALTYVGTSTVSDVYRTTDGGATWNLLSGVSTSPDYGRNDMCGIPGTSWFASCGAGAGNNVISFSSDNGSTWNNWGSTNIQYLTIDFVNPSTGWSGTFSDPSSANLYGFYKYNGGSLLQAPNANFTVNAAACVSVGVLPGNLTTGNPNPTYTWTTLPPTSIIQTSTSATPTIFFNSPGTYTIYLSAANSSSTSLVSRTVAVGACTGLADNSANEINFGVSPNPGKDVFHVALPTTNQVYNITVTNVLGSVVYSGQTTTTTTDHVVNLSGNKTGLYFMTITNNGVKTTKKIIIE